MEEYPVELAITRIAAEPKPLFSGHIRDIWQRKTAERELRESQNLLSSVTQNIREAIIRRSVDQGLLFVNEAYLKMYGYASRQELEGVQPEALYAVPGRRQELAEMLARESTFRDEEAEYRRKDGTTFWGLVCLIKAARATAYLILAPMQPLRPRPFSF